MVACDDFQVSVINQPKMLLDMEHIYQRYLQYLVAEIVTSKYKHIFSLLSTQDAHLLSALLMFTKQP